MSQQYVLKIGRAIRKKVKQICNYVSMGETSLEIFLNALKPSPYSIVVLLLLRCQFSRYFA